MTDILSRIKEIEIEKPEDVIIKKLRGLIDSGELKPGDKLPPERLLAEKFGVGRGHIRSAIKRLEFYGILKTYPQSGTIVSEMGLTMLDGLLNNILNIEQPDYQSLIEARGILEEQTTYLAAQRMNSKQKKALVHAHEQYQKKVEQGGDGMEEDIMFHIRIAELTGNQVLRMLIMIIAQDIIRNSRETNNCAGNRKYEALKEHQDILASLLQKDPEKAKQAMKEHLKNTPNGF